MHIGIKTLIGFIGVIAVFILAYFLSDLVRDSEAFREALLAFNYLGVFVVAIIGGLNLFIPVPAVVFVPVFVEVGLNIWLIVITIIIGSSIADSFSYMIGRAGRKLAEGTKNNKITAFLNKLKDKYYFLPIIFLFLFASLVPFPNEIILLPLGFMGYKIKHLLIPYVAGNAVFTIAASFGVINIFSVI